MQPYLHTYLLTPYLRTYFSSSSCNLVARCAAIRLCTSSCSCDRQADRQMIGYGTAHRWRYRLQAYNPKASSQLHLTAPARQHRTGSAEMQAGRTVAQPKPQSRRSHSEAVRGATVEVWKNRQRAWRWAPHLRCAVKFRRRRQARFQLSHAPSLSLARLDEVLSLLHQLADV